MTKPVLTTRVDNLDDLLGVIPHLLGFHPAESLVVLAVRGGTVALTARIDLTDLLSAGHAELLVDRMLLRVPGAALFVIAYGADPDDCWAVLDRVRDHLGYQLLDVIHVGNGRYRAGSQYLPDAPHDPKSSAAAAEAAVLGMQARPSRNDIAAALVAPAEELERLSVEARAARRRKRRITRPARPALLRVALDAALADLESLAPAECAWLACLADDVACRDEVISGLFRDGAATQVQVWSRVVRQAHPAITDGAVGLLGLTAWIAGEGALQSICAEILEKRKSRIELLAVLDRITTEILPPELWDELQPEVGGALR